MTSTTMTTSHPTVSTSISYKSTKQNSWTFKFNDRTNMDEIHQFVRKQLGNQVQDPFVIQFTHHRTKQLTNLNQVILDSDDNPYKNLPPSEDSLDALLNNIVELHVIDYFPDNGEIFQEQTVEVNSQTPTFQFSHTSREHIFESRCQQELLVNNIDTDIPALDGEDFSFPLLLQGSNGTLLYTIETDDDFDLVGTTAPMENSSPTTIQNPIVQSSSKEVDQLHFTLDVNPIQKGKYRSDRFNQRESTKTNGYICRIQGIKAGGKSKASVLPRFHVPMKYRNKPNTCLRVHAVYQKSLNGTICWIKHPDKKFLPLGCDRNTPPTNPVTLGLDKMKATKEGDYKLDLKMVNYWDKSDAAKEQQEGYQLNEESAKFLHPIMDLDTTKYDPKTPRLLAMIEENGVIQLDTAFLSDFIRSTRDEKLANSKTVNP